MVAWTRQLREELQGLRQGVGLRPERVARAKTLLRLPLFRGLGPEEDLAQIVHDLLVIWLGRYDHAERREALEVAFGVRAQDGLPLGAERKLQRRRSQLAQNLGTSVQAVRDREDDGIEDLISHLLDQSVDISDHLIGEMSAPGATFRYTSDLPSLASFSAAGISETILDFYRGVPWAELLANSSELDIFFTYGRSWRRSLTAELKSFLERCADRTRVVLPDIKAPKVTALPEIAKRAGVPLDRLIEHVRGAQKYFLDVGAEVWASDNAELYASYRFDATVVLTLYNHQRGQTEGVPTILCSRGGTWYKWFQDDFEALLRNSDWARRVTPEELVEP